MTAWTARRLEAVAAATTGTAVAVAAARGDERALLCRGATARTRFEIGSLTKTFTAVLLAEAAARGDVRRDDPIGAYLPRWAVPRGHGGRIALEHLATHTSGLPRLPPGLLPLALRSWYTNPYAAFTREHLLHALSRTRVRRPPGTRVRYSNFGVGLLGHLLAAAAGADDFAEPLAARVLTPLGLADTTCDPDRPQATGHLHGRPLPPWRIPGLAGAGALRSSAEDLLHYLQALASPACAPATAGPALRAALHDVARPRLTAPGGDRLCLVWKLRMLDTSDGARELLFHSGGTRGFTSFAGFAPGARTCLVALTDTAPTQRGAFIRSAYRALRDLAARPAA